jgi:hypothetical protein
MSPRSVRVHPLTWAALAAAVIAVVVAVVYFGMGHLKHGLAFLGLAAVALVGAWFTTAPGKAVKPGDETPTPLGSRRS